MLFAYVVFFFFFSLACFVVRDITCVEVGVDRIIILQREREIVPQPEGEYKLSIRPCRYLLTVTRSSSRGSVDGFRRETLQRFATFDSLSVQRRLEGR